MATFRKIDDSAVAFDRPVSTATLNDIAESNDASRQERVRLGTLNIDPRNAWEIAALYPMAVPLMWRVTPGVNSLDIHLRYHTTTILDPIMYASVAVVKAGDLLSGLYEPVTRTSIASSASVTNTTMNVSLRHLTGALDWVCVFVIFQSAQGAIEDLEKAGKTVYEINHGGTGNLAIYDDNDEHTIASAPYIPALALQKWFLNDESDQMPYSAPQQVCQITASINYGVGAGYLMYWLYPPMLEYDLELIQDGARGATVNETGEGVAANDLYARIFALGTIKLHSITIEEGPPTSRVNRGTALNTDLMPRSRTTSAIYSDGERVFSQHTRVHALGSTNDPTDLGILTKPRYNVGNYVHDLNSAHRTFNAAEWQTIAQAPVGDGGQYVPPGGTVLTHTLIEASGILLLAQFIDFSSRPGGNPPIGWQGMEFQQTGGTHSLTYDGISVRARLRLVDFDGTSNAVNSDDGDGEAYELINYPAVNIAQTRGDQNASHPHGYLANWFIDSFEDSTGGVAGTNRIRQKTSNHALRDLWDIRFWGSTPFVPFRLAVKDTQTGVRRLCQLQINIPAPANGLSTHFAKYCHLVTWTVIQSPSLRPDEDTLGA